jgi:hypothetical protein
VRYHRGKTGGETTEDSLRGLHLLAEALRYGRRLLNAGGELTEGVPSSSNMLIELLGYDGDPLETLRRALELQTLVEPLQRRYGLLNALLKSGILELHLDDALIHGGHAEVTAFHT